MIRSVVVDTVVDGSRAAIESVRAVLLPALCRQLPRIKSVGSALLLIYFEIVLVLSAALLAVIFVGALLVGQALDPARCTGTYRTLKRERRTSAFA